VRHALEQGSERLRLAQGPGLWGKIGGIPKQPASESQPFQHSQSIPQGRIHLRIPLDN
jgi:hypothetical protein